MLASVATCGSRADAPIPSQKEHKDYTISVKLKKCITFYKKDGGLSMGYRQTQSLISDSAEGRGVLIRFARYG